jgi:cyclophilin family peptidyl-prolyl cis-trans isomerase
MRWLGYIAGLLILAGCHRNFAHFKVETINSRVPAEISFIAESDQLESYEWNFGDGTSGAGKEINHAYYSSGIYSISLTAKKKSRTKTSTSTIMIEPPEKCLVALKTTYGDMLIELFDDTPQHQENFLRLIQEGFFEQLLFHRVIQGFMIQGGDPESRDASPDQSLGRGGPGYTIPAEFRDHLVHTKGALAAARTGDAANPEKRSSGSQFYIVQGKPLDEAALNQNEARKGKLYSTQNRIEYLEKGGTPFLDYEYTVFGRVVEGMDVIDKIAGVSTGTSDRPKQDVKMSFKILN